jgi:GNAT superfamily N-acetyltransferase
LNIKIRPGLLFDAQTIVNFQLTMAMETENLKLDLATVTAGVQAIFDNPERGKYFVAELDGKVVASLLIIPEWSDWRNGFVWWIHSVYVEPKLRGQKIFSQMYEFIKAKTTSEGSRGLRLYVEKTNLKAQRVYQNLGMTKEHYELYEWLN